LKKKAELKKIRETTEKIQHEKLRQEFELLKKVEIEKLMNQEKERLEKEFEKKKLQMQNFF